MIVRNINVKASKEETTVELDDKEPPKDNIFFSRIMGAKLVGHILHLQADEFATHIALDEFYKAQQKNADAIIETYQGAIKELVKYDIAALTLDHDASPLIYLGKLRSDIQDVRYEVIPEKLSNVHNELDNFITAIDTAVYKITFLK